MGDLSSLRDAVIIIDFYSNASVDGVDINDGQRSFSLSARRCVQDKTRTPSVKSMEQSSVRANNTKRTYSLLRLVSSTICMTIKMFRSKPVPSGQM